MCNCKNFEKFWDKIAKKFQLRKGMIRHKRVSKELRRAKRFAQRQRIAGLASAAKRNTGSTALEHNSNTRPTKKRKRKENEKEKKVFTNTNTSEQAPSFSSSVRPAPSLTKCKRPPFDK